MKEFCKKNQVDQKSFNKSFLTYQKLMKEKRLTLVSRGLQGNDEDTVKEEELKIEST
jgi:hypothetical protein